MYLLIGSAIVLASVFGGYILSGGHLFVLAQPFEFLIIGGAAIGGFVTANRKPVLKAAGGAVAGLLKGEKYDKNGYLELLSLLYSVFKLAKIKGALVLEAHVENPDESTLFQRFPMFFANRDATTFLCDYLRLLTLGTDNHHEMETLMDEEIETHHAETGHTDARPYATVRNYGNWELSADRANASRRELLIDGLPPERIEKVVGMAEHDPLVPEDRLSARNRRISIVLMREAGVN